MVLGYGKLKTNHCIQQGGKVVHPLDFNRRNITPVECVLMSGSEVGLWSFLLEEQSECRPWGGVSVMVLDEHILKR